MRKSWHGRKGQFNSIGVSHTFTQFHKLVDFATVYSDGRVCSPCAMGQKSAWRLKAGSGPCRKCQKCNPDHCNFPDKTVPAMEACGIDVFATVRNNNLEIHTLREKGDIQNHFGLILVE